MRKTLHFAGCILAFFAFALPSLSQVTVTASLTDGTGTVYRTAYLHFQLQNCGANPPVTTGTTMIVQDSFDLRPSSPGSSISGTVIGNDQILCGDVKSTSYLVTPMKDSAHPLRTGFQYVICSASATLTTCGNALTLGTFNLVTALPMTQNPPSPGLTVLYGNPTNTQTLAQPVGTQMNYTGTHNFCSATVLCGGGSSSFSLTVNGGSALTAPVNFQDGVNTTVTNPSGSNVQVNVPSATTGAVGVVKLANDIGGTALLPTVLHGTHITDGSIGNSGLTNPSVTVNGTLCTLGGSCTPSGGGGGNPVLENCTPDQTGNSFYTVASLSNFFAAHWEFIHGQASYINCTVFVPTAQAGATLVLDIFANDATAGHTANFQTCDVQITSGTLNVGALTCAANQAFTTTGTAYQRVTLTYNVQSTLSNNGILVVKIATSTTGTQPTANMIVQPHFIL